MQNISRTIARAAGAANVKSTITLGDLDQAEVDVGAEPTIEPYFFLAVGAPALDGREVQKTEIDRLLQLVGVRTRQDNP